MRLFGKVDGTVDRFDRAGWWPIFDLAYLSTNIATCGRAVASVGFVQGAQASGGTVRGAVMMASFVQGAQKKESF